MVWPRCPDSTFSFWNGLGAWLHDQGPSGSQEALCPPCEDTKTSLDLACSPREERWGWGQSWCGVASFLWSTSPTCPLITAALTPRMCIELLFIPQDPTLLLACPSTSPSFPVPAPPSSHSPTSSWHVEDSSVGSESISPWRVGTLFPSTWHRRFLTRVCSMNEWVREVKWADVLMRTFQDEGYCGQRSGVGTAQSSRDNQYRQVWGGENLGPLFTTHFTGTWVFILILVLRTRLWIPCVHLTVFTGFCPRLSTD